MRINFVVLFGCFISGTLGQYYFVTVPNVIRYNYDETVTVSVFGLNDANVQVWLQLGKKKFSMKQVIVPEESSPQTTHVRLTEQDILDHASVKEKKRTVQICSQYGKHSDCQEVLISYETGYIIMQTDKPIYTPRQIVKIRALAFDESLKAVKNETVGIDIISPSSKTLDRKLISKSVSGFYTCEFHLPPHPEMGLWTARAFLKGQYETNARALFTVEEYVLSTFGVSIDVSAPFILTETQSVTVTVKAKYVYGKSVNGNARLELNLRGDLENDHILTTERKMLVSTQNQNSVAQFKINVVDIMASAAINNMFPDGKHLEVTATVFEDETGKEERSIHGSTLFTKQPYKFKFTESKLNFRPGMIYFMKLEMLYANGAAVSNEEVEIQMFDNDVPRPRRLEPTDSEGKISDAFLTSHMSKIIKFVVSTRDGLWKSDEFIVNPYVGENQIQVEMITADGSKLMRAYTNIKGGSYTGMLFMVVSRGNVVFTKFRSPSNQASNEMTDLIEKQVSPSGRLIVFYVDKKTDEIVADSVKFYVRSQCRGKTLSINSDRVEKVPGTISQLTLKGDPYMYVGLNIIDKALLSLNSKHVLRKNKMFDTLESHDLGCGEGSGFNSADVFKSTGLTVLTNANIPKAALQRNSMDCAAKQRMKRQALNECYGADKSCCDRGTRYAEDMQYQMMNGDAPTVCKNQVAKFATKGNVTMKCVRAYFRSCLDRMTYLIKGAKNVPFLDIDTDFISDLERIFEGGDRVRTRSDFRESWQFDMVDLDQNGEKEVRLGYPDSITEWMIQGIGISSEGVCIAEPVNVTTSRDLSIQLELPYKAIRLEVLEVKATIFNYGMDNKTVNVYLTGHDELCYDAESGKPSRRTQAVLTPNSAQTVRFPMVPMKEGNFPVTVTALVYDIGFPETDAVKKYLYVENEGIEEKIAIQVCLDPLEQSEDCQHHERVSQMIQKDGATAVQVVIVDLTLPQNSIPTTGSWTGHIQGNIMDSVVRILLTNGIESLFSSPVGAGGEETMIRLAQTVSAMKYLKQTKQVTDEIEQTGNQLIRYGVNREVSKYRHPDGSYSAWQSRPSSTWLTAFVAKIFCQAETVVDDAVDEKEDIGTTIDWLVNHVEADGSYKDTQPVLHREMIGQLKENQDASLTAFVLVALEECSIQSKGLNGTITRAMEYIEKQDRNMLRNNPYILALSTYALALSKSTKRYEFKDLLRSIKISTKTDGSHWGNAGGFPASANSVETTAYALLAMLELGDIKTSGEIVRWLTSQRDAKGAFRTTQDAVVGLQALSEYNLRTYSQDLDFKIILLAAPQYQFNQQFSVTNENSVYQLVIQRLPVESGDNKLIIKVSGQGTGRMMIDLRYNRPAMRNEICGFNVADIAIDDVNVLDRTILDLRNCDVCGKCENEVPPEFYDYLAFDADAKEIARDIGRKKREPGRRDRRILATYRCVKFSVSAAYEKTGMAVVTFGLEAGVEVIQADLDKLVSETENIDAYEYDGKGFVAFYLRRTSFNETKFVFRLKDTFDDFDGQRSRQPAVLTVYDYYNPDRTCSKMYRTVGEAFSYQCDNSEKPQCNCLHNICVKSMKNKIVQMAKNGNKPAIQLRNYTCNAEKADYAVFVKITGVFYDASTQQRRATAVVLKSIRQGVEGLVEEDDMLFFYPLSCEEPALAEGDKVYIIGKDGNKFMNNNGELEYQYRLTGTALVIKQPTGASRNLFVRIMRKFEDIMSSRGCPP